MSVRRNQNGHWMIDIVFEHPDGTVQRIRKSSPVQTKRGAESYERDVREALAQGIWGKRREVKEGGKPPTLAEFSVEFLAVYAETNNKPSEVESKQMIFRRHLIPTLGEHRLDQINRRHLDRYKSLKLKQGLSPKTINNHLTVLRRMLVIARDWDIIDTVPPIQWLKAPKPSFDFLSFDEAERLVEKADAGLWQTMILLALRTGLRQGELLALRWDDVDLVAGRLQVNRAVARGIMGTPKSGRSRNVPLAEKTRRALYALRHLKGELVFSNQKGALLNKGECKWPLWRACQRAGIRKVGWHVLRHTFASHLVMKGVPLKVIQELLGHATIEMTMRYAHLSPGVHRTAVELLDESDTSGNIAAMWSRS